MSKIIGYLHSGAPVFAISGGAEDDPEPEPDTGEETEPEPEPDKDLEAEIAKWKEMARKHEDRAKKNAEAAEKLAEIEDAKKSEQERLQEQLDAAKAEGTQASARLERLDVALDKAPDGMSLAKVRKLADRLTGSTREELEADADELFADFAPAEPEPDTGRGRPKERLKPGASNADDPDADPQEIANRIMSRSRI